MYRSTRFSRWSAWRGKPIQCLLAIALCLEVAATDAAPGSLDPTFSNDGKVVTSFLGGRNQANAMALQSDGKIVVAGTCDGSDTTFCIARYDPDGTLDLSFKLFGKLIARVSDGEDKAYAVAIQPDGKIVVAGYCLSNSKYDFCVARFDSEGEFDPTFSTDGKRLISVTAESNFAYAIALQTDGKIILAGTCGPQTFGDFCLVRLLANGQLDNSFSNDGKVVTSIERDDRARAVAVQPDGKIIVVGGCNPTTSASDNSFCAVRYTASGALDTSFATDGKTTLTYLGNGSQASSVAVQPDDKIMIGGYCYSTITGGNSLCLVRLNESGNTDTSFINGYNAASPGAAQGIVLQPDGKIVVAGYCSSAGNSQFCVALYHSDGTLDQSFSSDGRALADISADDDISTAVALQADGKIVVAGYCDDGPADLPNFCAARFEGGTMGYQACSLDIDGDGKVLATTDSLIHARIALGLTGNAVIAGIAFPANAKRKTWGDNSASDIRKYLVTQCGLQFSQ
jgi:uncharacterized delta-60 repeat protein